MAYDRSLAPPSKPPATASLAARVRLGHPTGTTTEYDEGIDINQTLTQRRSSQLDDGGIDSIDPNYLVRDPSKGCAPVYPWNFVRTNTIFGVVHAAGGYTAWSDKHPAYSAVSGPGNGTNVDDYYSPEINSNVSELARCHHRHRPQLHDNSRSDSADLTAWTNSFHNIQCYDTLKVNAIVNEINGNDAQRHEAAPVPAIFGMNFQAVSVGQKLIEKSTQSDRRLSGCDGHARPPALLGEIQFVDAAIGKMVSELKKQGLLDSTLIIITAKHGKVPSIPPAIRRITTSGLVIPRRPLFWTLGCIPFSESPPTRPASVPRKTTFR